MGNGREVGELYAFFLEVSESFIRSKIHVDYDIKYPGKGMYGDLVKILAGGCTDRYKKKIMEHKCFNDKQKEHLTPPNKTIDQNKLDFKIYVQIYALIRGRIDQGPILYMIKIRKILCHHPLFTGRMYLENEWLLLKNHFIRIDFEMETLDSLKKEILGKTCR